MKRYTRAFWSILLVAATFLVASCDNDSKDRAEQKAQEKKDRAAFIEKHFPGAIETPEGIYVILGDSAGYTKSRNIERHIGPGKEPLMGAEVSVRYWGYLMDEYENGDPFDSNDYAMGPYDFSLFNFQDRRSPVQGWHIGISKMKEGGKATLIIPSELAYGSYDRPSIPAYSTLVFDVFLSDVQNP